MKFIKTLLSTGAVLGSLFAVVNPAFAQNWNWTRTAAPFRQWSSVATSADGTKLVAAGLVVAGGWGIYTSPDSGATWISNNVLGLQWSSVASSADGTKLVAAADTFFANSGGEIYTSADSGATWISNSVPNLDWRSVATSADGTKLVAVADNWGLFTSADSGATWISNSVPLILQTVASSADGTRLAAALGEIFTSTNSGATWTLSGAPFLPYWRSIASSADGTKLVAAASNVNPPLSAGTGWVYTSTDSGATWISNSLPSMYWNSVASSADGTKLVAVADDNLSPVGFPGGVFTSTNSGATWISNSAPWFFWTVASSADGSKLFAAVENGIYICISPSTPIQLLITNIVANLDGGVTLNCAGYAGYPYLMQIATNLTPPVTWQTVSTNVADTNGTWQFTDPNAGSCPSRFYRLATP
jgi:hypothetical protein